MAKITTVKDSISPASTFSGSYVTRIKDSEGTEGRGRGHTREQSRELAEKDYDDKTRGK